MASSPIVAAQMRRQSRRDTVPELAVRQLLWRRGLRYRVDYRILDRRRADIAFTRAKVAVFIDGCFWHGCQLHGSVPKSNRTWWRAKLEANRARDRDTDRRLAEAGWHVVRFWEHYDPADAADQIEGAVRRR